MIGNWYNNKRIGGLARFAIAITTLNVLGHTWLGFEQAWAVPFVGLAAAYSMELAIETIDAGLNGRRARYRGGMRKIVEFLLSAHISGLAVGMLLYANRHFWVIAFATAIAIASKALIRVPMSSASSGNPETRHVLNPSNFGIAVTLLLFPWVSIAPPYHFTEYAGPVFRWVLPLLIFVSGSFLNTKFTERVPLITAWIVTFALQAVIRSLIEGLPLVPALLPMTGLAFILFSFYMVTDPATTPSRTWAQIVFGASVSLVYCGLMLLHIVFGLFFALAIVTGTRGLWLLTCSLWPKADREAERLALVEIMERHS